MHHRSLVWKLLHRNDKIIGIPDSSASDAILRECNVEEKKKTDVKKEKKMMDR